MFGFISKKKLIKVAVDIYLKNDTSDYMDITLFRFRSGAVNSLRQLCSMFGVDIKNEVAKERARRIMARDSEERSEGK